MGRRTEYRMSEYNYKKFILWGQEYKWEIEPNLEKWGVPMESELGMAIIYFIKYISPSCGTLVEAKQWVSVYGVEILKRLITLNIEDFKDYDYLVKVLGYDYTLVK